MIEYSGRGILLDIEGTTSSVSFVYDVLFPYARRQLEVFLKQSWEKPEVRQACEQIAEDAGAASLAEWTNNASANEARKAVASEVIRLMDNDVKATGLKALQGLIWKEGFESGELRSHVYEDVPAALVEWKKAGQDVRVYSSGSVTAQQLFFAHTEKGDLTRFLNGHYDTTTGPKKEKRSYVAIAGDMQLEPAGILFCSDVLGELDAAASAGMETVLVVRPGNAAITDVHSHPTISSFAEINLS